MSTNRREILFEAGVQYGHLTRSWCPKMKPFIWGKKDGIHLINIALTDIQLKKAEILLEDIAARGLPILWVGTKKVACNVVTKYAVACENPYFADRWVGGALTNYGEVKKSVTNMLYDEEIFQKSDRTFYTKKELNILRKRIDRSKKTVGGIEKLTWPVGALIVADVLKDKVAIREAVKAGIPVIAIVDTNCDPEGISIVIPGNDDLEKSVDAIFGYLSEAVQKGRKRFIQENPVEAAKQEEFINKKKNNQKQFNQNNKNNTVVNKNSEETQKQNQDLKAKKNIETETSVVEAKSENEIFEAKEDTTKLPKKTKVTDSALKKLDQVIEKVAEKKQKESSISETPKATASSKSTSAKSTKSGTVQKKQINKTPTKKK